MINALCAYQVVDSFAQCELCLSKQVRGRGLFITIKVADTDQESINLPPPPPHTPPPLPTLPLTGVLSDRLEASEPSSTLIPSTPHRNVQIWKSDYGGEQGCSSCEHASPAQALINPVGGDIHAPCSPMECKGQSSHQRWCHPSWQHGRDDSGDL